MDRAHLEAEPLTDEELAQTFRDLSAGGFVTTAVLLRATIDAERERAEGYRKALEDVKTYADSFLNTHLDDRIIRELSKKASFGLSKPTEDN